MFDRLTIKHWSVRARTISMVVFQLVLSLIGFVILFSGLTYISDLMSQQKQLVVEQQQVLEAQTLSFQDQRAELNAQQQAIEQQSSSLALQKAVFQVYQAYPQFLFWRLASTSSLSDNDVRNGDDVEKTLREAVKAIQSVDEELADAIDLFLLDLDDFNDNIADAIEAFKKEETRTGRNKVSATQNNVISMTSMLEVVLFVSDEVVVEASGFVSERLNALTASVEAVEAAGQSMSLSVEEVAASNELTVAEVSSRQQQVIVLLVIISIISLVVGAALSRSIVKPLSALKAKIEEIDKASDLTIVADDQRRDNIGKIGGSVNSMLSSFRKMVGDVRTGASEISHETDTQSHNNEQIRDALANLNLEIDSVATAITEMAATVQGINDITTNAATAASDGTHLCERGRSQTTQSSSQVLEVNDRLTESSKRLSDLKEQTEEIYAVVDVIQGVSEQTNLLALNAAIEAARAGDQGRGFAVVADEVRTLAQRTEQSSGEIKTMVEEFAKEVSATVASVESAKGTAENAKTHSDSAQESIASLLTSMQNIQQMNDQISQSTQEQTDATSAIDSSVTRISDLLAGIAEKASMMSDAMQRLNESTQTLEDQSRIFTTE